MRNFFIACILLIGYQSMAQEVLGPLTYNPRLYYSTVKWQPQQIISRRGYKNFVIVDDSTVLVESDTLQIPFIDDFTYPTLKPYNYTSYIYDSVINAIGPCDSVWNVSTVTDTLSFYPTYIYTYDTITHTLDSTANARIMFLNTDGFSGDCFYMGDTAYLYPRGYIDVFDTINGTLTFQIYDTTNVIVPITYAPVLYKSKIPNYTNWLDNNAYQNYTSGYLPPSIGVVTFDGLNSFGQPYSSVAGTWGPADVLTSKPINLGGLVDADSVYISFFYQPGGFGYSPLLGDSLVLQFYNGFTNNWDEIWAVTGDSIPVIPPGTPDAFQQVIIRLASTSNSPPIEYLYNGFQFRFLNYGSLTGFGSTWNIDYVRLGQNRSFTDTAINDLAFQYEFPSILKNYTQMPVEQFTGTPDLSDSIYLYVDNLNPMQAIFNPPATPVTTTASQVFPHTSVVLSPLTNTFNAGLEDSVLLQPDVTYTPPAVGQDTLLTINSQSVLDYADILPANDTISQNQVFYNTLAYDDGSAELAYGLQNLGTPTLKFAYDFTLNQPDTLIGFQILYANVNGGVEDLVFNFNLWDTLVMQDVYYVDSPVFTSNNLKPSYIDSVNGFTTYKISPVPLPKHFYFGWSQTDVNNLQIGYDMNSTKGRQHMYVFLEGFWQLSTIPSNGSPMLRLLLGHSYQIGTGIKNIALNPIKAYPNPTTGIISFDLPDPNNSYSIQLYSMLGEMSLEQTINGSNNTINIENLDQGVYLLRMTDNKSGISYQNKIVKSAKE
jgi:hypothetical protein